MHKRCLSKVRSKLLKMLNAVDENSLKYAPKSRFIYNENYKDPKKLNSAQKDKLILELYEKNKKILEENEQFRGKNFKFYLTLRKMGVNVDVV